MKTAQPDPTAEQLAELGAQLQRQGRPVEAEAALRAALRLAPQAPRTRAILGESLLSQGRYAEGWPLMEARLDVPALGSPRPPLDEPEWRGEPIAGKRLMIVGEQGAGDQIMFARFAPILRAQGVEVMLFCLPSLARLFEASLGVTVFAMAGQVEAPDPDVWALSGSLPGRMGVTLETLPAQPYLSAAPRSVGGRIGVAVRGNPRHSNDAHRSLPPALAERLLRRPGVVDLAPEATGASDFADTAAIIAGLDLVISVDTAVAHLAGAMGKPVWILLPKHGLDWRWMTEGADSPWYPSARLFRQTAVGAWGPVLDDVEAMLG